MSGEVPMHEVLISYSTKDKTWADAACAVLEAHGIRCWIAPRDIMPGTEWAAAIIAGIDACKVMVLIFSASTNESPQVRREVGRAISKGLTVVPCRVEDVRPVGAMEYALGNTHWLDVFTPPVERQMKRLAETVQALLLRDSGASSIVGEAPVASDSAGRNESLREIPLWNWRRKHGLVTSAAFTLFVLVVVGLTVVFWPRKDAPSMPGNAALVPEPVPAEQTASLAKSPAAATSTTPTQAPPVKQQAAKKPANDYEELVTGRWVSPLASLEDFSRVLGEKSYVGSRPEFNQGVLVLSAPHGETNSLTFEGLHAKNIIIHARVKKKANVGSSNIAMALRCTKGDSYVALLTGRRRFVIGRDHGGKWEDLAACNVAENHGGVFFEFAFAAIEDKLTAYVNGRRILLFTRPELSDNPPGAVQVSVFSAFGQFQDIKVQVLDKPIATPQTPPRPVERSNSSPSLVEPAAGGG